MKLIITINPDSEKLLRIANAVSSILPMCGHKDGAKVLIANPLLADGYEIKVVTVVANDEATQIKADQLETKALRLFSKLSTLWIFADGEGYMRSPDPIRGVQSQQAQTKCQGLLGWAFGHNYHPVFEVEEGELPKNINLQMPSLFTSYDTGQTQGDQVAKIHRSMKSYKKTYIHHVCQRCGDTTSISESNTDF